MSIAPERLAAIRLMPDDEFAGSCELNDAVEDLLGEVDNLRSAVRALAVLLRGTCETLELGGRPNLVNFRFAALAADAIAGGDRG
ncbi:hypothetical protein [Streptacidiphilus sp. PAMC 29251]